MGSLAGDSARVTAEITAEADAVGLTVGTGTVELAEYS